MEKKQTNSFKFWQAEICMHFTNKIRIEYAQQIPRNFICIHFWNQNHWIRRSLTCTSVLMNTKCQTFLFILLFFFLQMLVVRYLLGCVYLSAFLYQNNSAYIEASGVFLAVIHWGYHKQDLKQTKNTSMDIRYPHLYYAVR